MSQALGQRQQRYDQSVDMISEATAQFGQAPSIHSDVMQDHIQGFQEDIHSIVDEYGGDYGMARAALSRRVSQEAADPFYQKHAQIAQFAEQERKQIEDAGGIQNVFMPEGSVSQRPWDPDAPVSAYQPRVIEQDDFMQIIDDIGDEIQPNLVQYGLSQSDAERVRGMIRDNQVSGLSQEEVEAVARLAYNSFIASAPSIQFAPEDHWTRDPQAVVDIMMSRWAGKYATGHRHESTLRNVPSHVSEGPQHPESFHSPAIVRGATEEERRDKIDAKYEELDNSIRQIIADGRISSNSSIEDDIYDVNPDTGEITINEEEFNRSAHLDPVGTTAIEEERRSDAMRAKKVYENFINENPFYKEMLEQGATTMEALQALKDYEYNASVAHYTDYGVPNPQIEDALVGFISAAEQEFGRVEYSTKRGKRVRQRIEEGEARSVLAEAHNNIQRVGFMPGQGEITLTVVHDDEFKTLYFSTDVLPEIEADLFRGTEKFLRNHRDPTAKKGETVVSGITYKFTKQYDPEKGQILPVYEIDFGDESPKKTTDPYEFFNHFIFEGILKRVRTLGQHETTRAQSI